MLLENIEEPADIKSFSYVQLQQLATELRQSILEAVEQHGGHMSSNFGVVELSIALHYVFDSPQDALVWDTGHQCYAHKMLTGRQKKFGTLRQKDGLAGFPRREESEHDILNVGHASTAISAALGLQEGRRLQNHAGKVIAIIGDGSLTGGLSFEALNHAGHLGSDLLVILNDNTMSIARNVGAIARSFSRVTGSLSYTKFRNWVDKFLIAIPFVGESLQRSVARCKAACKSLIFFRNNLFNNLGFKYLGPFDGHNLKQMIKVLKRIKKLKEPVFLHLVTTKGRGHDDAEANPSKFHGLSPNTTAPKSSKRGFSQVFSSVLCNKAAQDSRIVAITAAMPSGTGLQSFKDLYPQRFYDVGIAEQHAITLAVGLALSGLRPVVAIYSTFMQRAVDQIIHDAVLHRLPIIFAMDRSGLVPGDGDTHQGIYDISLFRPLQGVTMLAPSSEDDMQQAFSYALEQENAPIFIRYPKRNCPQIKGFGHSFVKGEGVLLTSDIESSSRCLLFCTGALLYEAQQTQLHLSSLGQAIDILHLRFIKPLCKSYLNKLTRSYRWLCVMEDGIKEGGIGQEIAQLCTPRKVKLLGVDQRLAPVANYQELLEFYGLDTRSISESLKEIMMVSEVKYAEIT